MDESVTVAKKTTRVRKTASAQTVSIPQDTPSVATPQIESPAFISQAFADLTDKLLRSQQEFDNLQKEITQMKMDWAREQKQHESELVQQKAQEELERKREQETYQYSTNLARKRAEDEFQDKKLTWEKELLQRKEELAKEKQELENLRKLVSDFDNQKDRVVQDAQEKLEKELSGQFDTEKKLREQEVKAEKEVLGLKISNLESENSRLTKEIEILKKSLDEATRQVKEIAVKVIESGSQAKTQTTSES